MAEDDNIKPGPDEVDSLADKVVAAGAKSDGGSSVDQSGALGDRAVDDDSRRVEDSGDNEGKFTMERSQEAVRALTAEVNGFFGKLDGLFDDTPAGRSLNDRVHAGRFPAGSEEAWSRLGVQGSDGTRVLYGDPNPIGNMEGSMYTTFGDDRLRVRWAGDLAMYLNGQGNYVRLEKDRLSGDIRLEPGRIGGNRVLGITEEGVETADPAVYGEYVNQKMNYDYEVKRAERISAATPRKGFARFFPSTPGQGSPAESGLVEPHPPAPIIVSHRKFTEMMDTMREGLQKTASTLTEAKVQA